MPKMLIIADDLSGALDTGVHFAGGGVATLVTVDPDIDFGSIGDVDVLVVDTETRHLRAAEAGKRVGMVARRGLIAGVEYFYKKTDSTLRGNVGAELEALMTAVGGGRLAFVPAYPKTGRTTRQGYHYVGDQLLAESAFSRDPLEPVTESFVPAVLAAQTEVSTRVVSVRDESAMQALGAGAGGITVFDCASDEDLQAIARMLLANDSLRMTAGPGGFAEALTEVLGFQAHRRCHAATRGPLLLVCGSASEVSRRQVEYAVAGGFLDIALPADVLAAEGLCVGPCEEAAFREAIEAADAGRHVVVRIEGNGVSAGGRTDSSVLAQSLASVAAHVLREGRFGSCAVFGGDTAFAVMSAMNWTRLEPIGEIAPGVVLSRVEGPQTELGFITKAGGFGDEDVVEDILGSLDGS